jgi:hypothetical protein
MASSLILDSNEMREFLNEKDNIYDNKYNLISKILKIYYGFISTSLFYFYLKYYF